MYLFPESLMLNGSVIFPENTFQNWGCVLQSVISYNQGNMVAPQLDKKVLYFIEPKGSLQSMQEAVTFPYPESGESRSIKGFNLFQFLFILKTL